MMSLTHFSSAGGGLSKSESVPGFQMTSEDFPALPGTTTKSSGELMVEV